MRYDSTQLKWRLARNRALIGFYLVAMAQFLSPAAAADPASRIDPPSWSHTYSQRDLLAYGNFHQTQEPKKKQTISRALLRQILEKREAHR